jgi:virulence factor Mce-like protein
MRRVATLVVTAMTCAGAVVGLAACGTNGNGSGGSYRVDAIFDDARGIIPGQLVKIAGARVGTISDVTLTPDYKARVELTIDSRFAPFHTDASCSIKPEGLIAENFVDCNPGSAAAAPLAPEGGQAATVPLAHNTEPVSLTDLFNVWDTPTTDRLTVLVNELGMGLAGRGQDLNALLRRANPALALARQAIALVNQQRGELAASIAATEPVTAALASRSPAVQAFISRAASVTATTAAHSGPLAQGVARLPGLLAAAEPALRELDATAASGIPILANVHAAAPNVNRLIAELGPFAQAGTPTVRALSTPLAQANTALREGAPVVSQLRTFGRDANPTGEHLDQLLVNLRDRGFVENLLGATYSGAGAGARYDQISHILPANIVAPTCILYASQPETGCSAWYPNQYQRTVAARTGSRPAKTGVGSVTTSPAVSAPVSHRPAPASTGAAPALPQPLGQLVQSATGAVQGVGQQVQGVLGTVTNAAQGLLGGGSSAQSSGSSGSGGSDNPAKLLLDLLLK